MLHEYETNKCGGQIRSQRLHPVLSLTSVSFLFTTQWRWRRMSHSSYKNLGLTLHFMFLFLSFLRHSTNALVMTSWGKVLLCCTSQWKCLWQNEIGENKLFYISSLVTFRYKNIIIAILELSNFDKTEKPFHCSPNFFFCFATKKKYHEKISSIFLLLWWL